MDLHNRLSYAQPVFEPNVHVYWPQQLAKCRCRHMWPNGDLVASIRFASLSESESIYKLILEGCWCMNSTQLRHEHRPVLPISFYTCGLHFEFAMMSINYIICSKIETSKNRKSDNLDIRKGKTTKQRQQTTMHNSKKKQHENRKIEESKNINNKSIY